LNFSYLIKFILSGPNSYITFISLGAHETRGIYRCIPRIYLSFSNCNKSKCGEKRFSVRLMLYICMILYTDPSIINYFSFYTGWKRIYFSLEFIATFIFDIYFWHLQLFLRRPLTYLCRCPCSFYLTLHFEKYPFIANHISMQIVRCAWFIAESSTWVHILITLITRGLISSDIGNLFSYQYKVHRLHTHRPS